MLTRFAPSPTGYLHIGNVRTALICYLYAKKNGGQFLLRIDDTDKERSREEYVDAIKEDLTWLGIAWDMCARQSERLDAYHAAVEALKAAGRLYPCYETQQELEVKRKMQLSRGRPPIYDRAALSLTDEQKAAFEAQGKKPHYRFLLEDRAIMWEDEIKGTLHFEGSKLSDPILVREDGSYTYMLPSTVDDKDLGVTHVVRGEDHVSNTAIQIELFLALGSTVPRFAHNALIKTREGKMSKRKGDSSIRAMREEGIEPLALSSFLAKVGTSDPIEERLSLDVLVEEFDIGKFGKSQTIYQVEDITRLSARVLHQLSYADVKHRLPEKMDEAFWDAVRPNVTSVKEAGQWWDICYGDITPDIEDDAFVREVRSLLPEGVLTTDSWNVWIEAIKTKTGRKGKDLFMPLRKALTGMEHGPELKNLLPLMGRDAVLARLNGKSS